VITQCSGTVIAGPEREGEGRGIEIEADSRRLSACTTAFAMIIIMCVIMSISNLKGVRPAHTAAEAVGFGLWLWLLTTIIVHIVVYVHMVYTSYIVHLRSAMYHIS
jgi:hypothetical protein